MPEIRMIYEARRKNKQRSLNISFIIFLTLIISLAFLTCNSISNDQSDLNITQENYIRSKNLSPEATYIDWSGSLAYNEYYVFWTEEDIDSSYVLSYLILGSNPDINITFEVMSNASFNSKVSSDSYSISSWPIFEGTMMDESKTWASDIPYETSWAFIFLNVDSDKAVTTVSIDCTLYGTPDVNLIAGGKFSTESGSTQSDDMLPLLIIVGILGVVGAGVFIIYLSKKGSATSIKPVESRSLQISPEDKTATYSTPEPSTLSEPKGHQISDERMAEIVREGFQKAKLARKGILRNSIIALAVGSFLIFGGILSLDAGIGIYLLISDGLIFGLGVFLLLLTRIR